MRSGYRGIDRSQLVRSTAWREVAGFARSATHIGMNGYGVIAW